MTMVICLLMGKKSISLRLITKISNKFNAVESTKVSFTGSFYDFLFDFNPFDKSDIIKIHKYLCNGYK